ncbi:Rv1733c family protein [Sphaerimonospora mesophila]|uniref:Rv1733c family protein n=1 Tax=Sphaerimonospora mesophila TaxID=37483 RepID=UPI0006E324C3
MTQNPFARFARWLGLDRNPLRRRCDRVEAVVRLAAVLGVMVAVVLGVMLAVRTYGDGLKTEAQQRHTRHQVIATLMNEPDSPRLSPAGAAVGHVKAQWQAPDGRQWEGTIDASTSRHQGDTVRIWTDEHGSPVPRPQERETTVVSALTVGVGIPLAAATGLALVVAATRGIVQRRAKRAWEAQWTVVEPTWRINGR